MQFNKDSNSYIVIFLVVMVLVVAVSLSFVNSALKPTITKNEIVDVKSQILKSVVDIPEGQEPADVLTESFVLQEFDAKIEELLVDYQGNYIDPATVDETPFEIAKPKNFKKEIQKPEEERRYPVFKYSAENGDVFYIFPLSGLGLWDMIWGYMAIGSDYNTIKGAAFDHKGETPGLGARITESWYGNQFNGKKLFDPAEFEYKLTVKKGEGNVEAQTNEYVVDGLSGATLTADGLANMLELGAANYKPFFTKNRNN